MTTDENVIDGGSVIRKISWPARGTFKSIIESYRNYIKSTYGKRTIVFDGYRDQPSTKDQEHLRRYNNVCHKFKVKNETVLTVSQ